MTARLILICHGSTDAIRSASFPADEPLEEPSATRAAALAGTLPKADRCWTSPELRTRQTAQSLGLSANVEPMLRDCDYGRWAGRRFDEVQATSRMRFRHGCAIRRPRRTAANPLQISCGGWENGSPPNKPGINAELLLRTRR